MGRIKSSNESWEVVVSVATTASTSCSWDPVPQKEMVPDKGVNIGLCCQLDIQGQQYLDQQP